MPTDIIVGVKQLLLRVPDDVHQRLAALAAREGRSINSVATEMLDTAIELQPDDPRSVVRARAAAAGLLRSSGPRPVTSRENAAPDLATVRHALRDVGLTAAELIDAERGDR